MARDSEGAVVYGEEFQVLGQVAGVQETPRGLFAEVQWTEPIEGERFKYLDFQADFTDVQRSVSDGPSVVIRDESALQLSARPEM